MIINKSVDNGGYYVIIKLIKMVMKFNLEIINLYD